MKLVLDVENTVAFVKVSEKETIKVASPYHPDNKLVAVGFREIGDKTHTATFHHNQMESTPGGFILTQKALNESKVLIGHNLKHDLSWLLECGFTYTGTYWDTMLVEYILSKGMKLGLSLGDCVARAKLEGHKGDVMKKYLADKINVDDMPYEELIEYLVNDVEITEMLYLNQLERLDRLGETEKAHLMKAINLVNTFLPYLVEMERAGIYVDQQELGVLKQGYLDELNQLNNKLTTKVRELMGDKPYNLNSSDDLSAILYSRRPRNKKVWVERFNIGSELRNGVSKPKRLNIFKGEGFSRMLTQEMLVEQKCTARKCRNCNGVGTIYRTKKDGTRYANPNICHACERSGVEYIKSGEVAGLKLRPKNEFAKQAGFATDGPAIDYYLERKIPDEAREFLTALRRRSKLDTWVNTFCAQLQKFNINGLVHPSFNQHITATGRLSCSAPNMQNQPKRDKDFTLRKAFKSRFVGGRLYEADFGQLEFRIAALLANCVSAIKFIEEGKDIHAVTRDFFYGELELKPSDPWEKIDPKEDRQEAKAECVPLDSLILTREGWKCYHEVQVGEDVLAYDQQEELTKWTPLLKKVYYEDAECITLGNKHNWKVTCTPDHRWYGTLRTTKKGVRGYYDCEVLASDIRHDHRITTSAYCNEVGINSCPPDIAALLGWVYSDGTIRVSKLTGKTSQGKGGRRRAICASIIQKKFNQEIEELLSRVGISYTKSSNSSGCSIYRLASEGMREVFAQSGLDPWLPEFEPWVLGLSPVARKAFLDAVFLAEGHTREYDTKCISQNVGEFQEAIHLACTLEGYDVRVTHKYGYTGKDNLRMTLRNRRHITGSRMTKTPAAKTNVWCPQTKYGSWVMKQGDVVTITGNTFGPLYGKMTEWANQFYIMFPGIAKWHESLMVEAATFKQTISPSGRIYAFPYAERFVNRNGKVLTSGHTQIKNYSVQGFATGDLVLLVLMDIMDYLQSHDAKSRLCLQVHDSALVDAHPEEFTLVEKAFDFAFNNIYKKAKDMFGIEINVPLAFDLEWGVNWYGDKDVK